MLARVFEEAGLSTVALALIRNHAERCKPPRALFVPFPLGFALGRPGDPPFQHRVLRAAFDLLAAEAGPVLADFPEGVDAPAEVLQASELAAAPAPATSPTGTPDAGTPDAGMLAAGMPATALADPADELTGLRAYYEQWLADHDGRTMVGLTGIPQRRWRGLVRFLQAYADGRVEPYAERPADVSLLQFLGYAANDLKALYLEGRMARRPGDSEDQLARWFWAETAMGALLVRVADRVTQSDEPDRVLFARRIAR